MKRTLLFALGAFVAPLVASACCPQADCPEPVRFSVRDALTGEGVAGVEIETDVGRVDCRVDRGRTTCGGDGDGAQVVRMTLTAPGYVPVEIRGDFADNDDICPGCPTFDLSVDDVDVGGDVALHPEG